MIERKREVIKGFADYRIEGLETFDLYDGRASFIDEHALRVGNDTVLRAPNFVVATGSIVAPPIFPGLEETGYIDSDAALDLNGPPSSMIVLGGGYVAVELGQFFSRIGVATTILIRKSRLLSDVDEDVATALTEYLRDEGIRIIGEATVAARRAQRQAQARRLPQRRRRARGRGRRDLLRAWPRTKYRGTRARARRRHVSPRLRNRRRCNASHLESARLRDRRRDGALSAGARCDPAGRDRRAQCDARDARCDRLLALEGAHDLQRSAGCRYGRDRGRS